MRSRRFRLALLLAALAGLASCEINPQPPLPSRPVDDGSNPGPGAGGSLALGEGTGGTQSSAPVVGGGTSGTPGDNANGGSLANEGGADASGEGGAAGATPQTPDDGGASGADAGGAAGAFNVPTTK